MREHESGRLADPSLRTRPLRILDYADAHKAMSTYVRSSLNDPLNVLEAGCGRNSTLGLEGMTYRLVGVDIDAESLRLRKEWWNDLDEAIHADLRKVDLPAASFDIVYSVYVLEHIAGAEAVLDRLFEWVKPGGFVVMEIPDGDSVFGWVARHTPHRLHVWYKRHVQRRPNAGRPGFGPYPTVYDDIVSRTAIIRYCERHGIDIALEHGLPIDFRKLGTWAAPARWFTGMIGWASRGRLASGHANLQYVLRKPIEPAARTPA
jgi:SAM-dependent methyltransferase